MRSMVDLLILLLVFETTLSQIPAAAETDYVRLRIVEIPDEQGFERPVVALRFLAPSDWRIEGGVQWNLPLQCQAELATVHVRALAPYGDLVFEILPSRVWRWSDDPTEVDYWRISPGPGSGRRSKGYSELAMDDLKAPAGTTGATSNHLPNSTAR